jgi:integrase
MARNFTDKNVVALKPRDKTFAYADPSLPGHYIRVTPAGNKSFVAVARDLRGKQIWTTIGNAALMKVEEARERAREVIKRVKAGQDRAGPQSFESIANDWLKRHVDAKGLRDAYETRRVLKKHILPEWGAREFTTIRRGDVSQLLDRVEDESGARTADKVLEIASSVCRFYEQKHEDYVSPIIKGMKRYSPKDHARKRILSDGEIRKLWDACSTANGYGDLIKLLLLTGQRREKVASMRWDDVSADGTWTIPSEKREKGNAGELVLPAMALDIIKGRPRLASNPYILAGRDSGPLRSFHGPRDALKAKVGFEDWRIHDLRRTARSLMSRAGVRPHIAERVLGHAIRGVEGVYDRHSYREEKAQALQDLANLIESILNPDDSKNVVRMTALSA